jgi:hypothetical protein
MSPDVQADFEWSDRVWDKVVALAAKHLFERASFEDDTKHAADFRLYRARLPAGDLFLAARCRLFEEYFHRFPYDVTFRYWRSNGAKTEYEKIFKEGCAHWFIYAFVDLQDRIRAYRLLNLSPCRAAVNCGAWRPEIKDNHDGGRTKFAAFDLRRAPIWWGRILIDSKPAL